MTRTVPAGADAVFDVVTDLEHLSSWLPPGVEVERYGPNLVRLWTDLDEGVERVVLIDWEDLRVEWGGELTPAYSGRLRVLRVAVDRSAVTVDLTGPAGMPRHRVERWAEQALDGLATTVRVEPRAVPWFPPRSSDDDRHRTWSTAAP
ncbi:SRPBCC family protein [Actinosynnema sp. NPDC023587]|uniref:SRPBCC family protein n=1 Tax=Actinosynnema sp. NPDC023587 TaxID=3154695 RepID=UPI0033DB4A68